MLSAAADEGVWLEKALHDLCQPLTALQCRLFLGLQDAAAEKDTALREAMRQCDRTIELVRAMQVRMHKGEES